MGWKRDIQGLHILHRMLSQSGYIDCSFEIFASHFIPGVEINNAINWFGLRIELHHLILKLRREKIIPSHHGFIKLYLQHFQMYEGDNFKHETQKSYTLRSLKIEDEDFFEEIIEKINSLNN